MKEPKIIAEDQGTSFGCYETNINVRYEDSYHGIRVSRKYIDFEKTILGEVEIGWYATQDTLEEAKKFHTLYAKAIEIAESIK